MRATNILVAIRTLIHRAEQAGWINEHPNAPAVAQARAAYADLWKRLPEIVGDRGTTCLPDELEDEVTLNLILEHDLFARQQGREPDYFGRLA